MLTVNNLDIRFGEKLLFNNVSARINDNDRVGLVGVNGAGKSTLLKVIGGITETDPGIVKRPKRFTVPYLPQEATALDTGRTIYQEAENAFRNEPSGGILRRGVARGAGNQKGSHSRAREARNTNAAQNAQHPT